MATRTEAVEIVIRIVKQSLLLSASAILIGTAPVLAQQASQFLNIPSQTADQALLEIAQQFEIQIYFAPGLVQQIRAPRLSGRYTLAEALDYLLVNSGLEYHFTEERTVVVGSTIGNKPSPLSSPLQDTTRPEQPVLKKYEDIAAAGVGVDLGDSLWGDSETLIEEIQVTGSKISRGAAETAIPITVFSRQDVISSGQNELSDILLEIPSIASSVSTQNSQLRTQTSGLSVINLRGLSGNRTLVLIDGRRTVSNSPNSDVVGLATIPTDFIERIEVITGGASAIYGSQAVAGVVNVITRRNVDGLNLTARSGFSPAGGAEEYSFSATGGTGWADGKGRLSFNLTYDDEAGLAGNERDFATISAEFDPARNSLQQPDPSFSIPGGRFEGNRFYFDESGLQTDFDIAENGYEFRGLQTLAIPRDRILAAVNSDIDLTPDLNLFLNLQYASIDTLSIRAPDSLSNRQVGEIPLDNPFIPAEILADALARNQSGLTFNRRLVELGRRGRRVERDTYRISTGLSGNLSDQIEWELYYGWSRFNQQQSRFNDIVIPRFINALNAEPVPGQPGSFRCSDADARAEGCVPINIFGIGSISDAAADYVRLVDSLDAKLEQHIISASLSGQMFQTGAGPVSFATGVEYRRDTSKVLVDEFTSSEQSSLASIPNIDGAVRVIEGYGELVLPLIAGHKLAHNLNLEGALRIANYSFKNVGTVWSHRLGVNWSPTPDLRLRAQLSRAQRAPDIAEFFSPPRGDFDDVDDPCNGITATSSGVTATNCRSIAAINTAILEDGEFVQRQTNIFSPNSGNKLLREEVADTFTAGLMFSPDFLPGLSLSADFYDIKINHAINAISSQTILDQCFGDPLGFPGNIFCDSITRGEDGQLLQIDNQEQNLVRQRASGMDIALAYLFDLNERLAIPGVFSLRLLYSNIFKLEASLDGTTEETVRVIQKGEIGDAKHRARATLTWNYDALRVRWRTAYTGPAVDSNERMVFFENRSISDPLFLNVGDEWVHSIHAQYQLTSTPAVTLFAGVNNIFDNLGPFLPDGTVSGGTNNFASEYGSIGRFLYFGATFSF